MVSTTQSNAKLTPYQKMVNKDIFELYKKYAEISHSKTCPDNSSGNYCCRRNEEIWSYISSSKHITPDMIINNPDLLWDWENGISHNPNLTKELIDAFPNKPWDWENGISGNTNLTKEIIDAYPDKPWDWKLISRFMKMEELTKLFGKPLRNDYLGCNSNLSIDFIKKYDLFIKENTDRYLYYWDTYKNANITMKDMTDNPDIFRLNRLDLNQIEWLIMNPNLTLEIFDKYIISNPNFNDFHHWRDMSSNTNLTSEILTKYINANWDWKKLSKHPCLTFEIVYKNPEKPWDWYQLSKHPNISWICIKNTLHKDWIFHWDWCGISDNPNITWNIVKNNLDLDWQWHYLIQHPNITWDIIKNNPNYDWPYNNIINNPNCNCDVIKENIDDILEYYDGIYEDENPNMTIEMFELLLNSEKNNCDIEGGIMSYKFNDELLIEQILRQHFAAFKIQTYWRRANYNPEYELCKRRLMMECEELGIMD